MTFMDPLLAALMPEFEDDHVGLWTVVKQVRRAFPEDQPEEIRAKTLALILYLLQMGYIEAGFPTEDGRGFEPWPIKPYGAVSRIFSGWKDPEAFPKIGEIAWFTTPRTRSNEPSPVSSGASRRT